MSMSSPSIGSLKDAIKALQALPDAFRQRAAQIESIYKSQPEVKRLCGEKRAGAAPSTTYDKAQSETVNQIKLLQNTISAVSNSLLELWSSSQTSIAHADEHSRLLALVIMFNYQTINTKTYSSTLEFFGGETRKKMVRSRKMVPHQDVKEKLAKSPELNLDLCATESYGSTIHFNDRERERGVRHHDNSISKSQLDIFDENPAAAANAIGNVATMSMGKLSTTSASTSILAKRVPGPPPKMKAVAMAVAATSSPMMGRATPQDAVAYTPIAPMKFTDSKLPGKPAMLSMDNITTTITPSSPGPPPPPPPGPVPNQNSASIAPNVGAPPPPPPPGPGAMLTQSALLPFPPAPPGLTVTPSTSATGIISTTASPSSTMGGGGMMAIADQLREKAAQRALRAAQSPMVDPLSPAAKPTATLSSESSPSGIAAGTLQDQLKARLAKRQEQGASPTSPTPVANNTPKNTGVSNGGGDSFADQLRERMAKRQAAAAAGSATGFEKFEKKVNVDNSDNQNLSSGSQSQDSSRRMEGSSNNVVAEKPKWKRTEAAKTGNPNLPLKSASASAASSPLIPAAISPLSSTRASVENISRIAHVANVERSSVESSLVQSKLGDENETVSSSKLDKQMGDVRTGGASPKTLKKPASWTGKSNIPKIPVAEIASLRLSSELQSKPDLKVSSGFSLSITGKSLSQKSLDKEKQSNSTSKNASAESLYDKKEIEAPKGTLYPKSAEIAGDAPVAQVQEYVTALGDFTASETGQLSLNSGEMYIRLVNDFGNGWSYGGTIDGLEQGVFPQTFVQPVEM